MATVIYKATLPRTRQEMIEHYQAAAAAIGRPISRQEAKKAAAAHRREAVFIVEVEGTPYQANVEPAKIRPGFPDMTHLSIRRVDRQLVKDWRHLQEIKNALLDPECEAVELYPAESRLIDSADQWHLWAFRHPGLHFPFGFEAGRMTTDSPSPGVTQRPFRVTTWP